MKGMAEFHSAIISLRKKTISRTSRLFSESITLDLTEKICRSFKSLSLNVCGTFFLTFGLFTVVSSVLMHLLNFSFASNVSLFAGIIMTAVSIPMLFSRDNISTALLSSFTGSVVCECVGVRMISLVQKQRSGHINQGFASGIIAGLISMAFSTGTVLLFILMAFMLCVILAFPTAGIMFSALVLPFFNDRILGILFAATLLSFVIKLLRGKRTASAHITGIVFLVFSLTAVIGLIRSPEALNTSAWKFIIFLSAYFISSLILKSCRDCVMTMIVISLSFGAVSLLYCLGYGIDAFVSLVFPDTEFYGSYILDMLASLPVFVSGGAALFAAAAVPISVGMALRSDHRVPGIILWFAACADVAFLALSDFIIPLFISLTATIILLMCYGRRWIYITAAISVPALIAAAYFTGITEKIGTFIKSQIIRPFAEAITDTKALSDISSFRILFGGDSMYTEAGNNFYVHLVRSFGLISVILLSGFFIITLVLCVKLSFKTIMIDRKRDTFSRFGSVRSANDTRLGVLAPLISASVILCGGILYDLFFCGALYTLLWALLGICISYRRCALKEMSKAESAENYNESRHNAEITIKF